MFRISALKIFIAVVGISQVLCEEEPSDRQPVYKYRYETEDMMKTSASSVPVRGYHVVEGGYYPAESGLIGSAVGPIGAGGLGVGAGKFYGPIGYGGIGGAGIGGAGIGGAGIGIGGGGIGLGGGVGHIPIVQAPIAQAPIAPIPYGPKFIGGGGIGGGIGAAGLGAIGGGGGYVAPIVHGFGGEEVEKSEFSGEKKNIEDGKFEKAHGQHGGEVKHGQEGYSKGAQAVNDIKGENGYYSNAAGGKNVVEDGKQYHGAQNFNQEGKNGAEQNIKKGHKKGHVIKGYKSSHHKDETGKTEEYYDEEHDEGNNVAFNGQNGAFGQKGASAYKGGHEDGKFNELEQKKTAHLSNQFALNKQNADQGKYGENKYSGTGSSFGVNNGVDQQSLLGHQENARFFKHHPVPFYHHV